jgi:hypothetical protein
VRGLVVDPDEHPVVGAAIVLSMGSNTGLEVARPTPAAVALRDRRAT